MFKKSYINDYLSQNTQGIFNMDIKNIFHSNSGAKAFFSSIILWGIGIGSFSAALNNYLSDIHHMDSIDLAGIFPWTAGIGIDISAGIAA